MKPEKVASLYKQTEEAFSESELRFRALFGNMIDGIAVYKAINNGEERYVSCPRSLKKKLKS